MRDPKETLGKMRLARKLYRTYKACRDNAPKVYAGYGTGGPAGTVPALMAGRPGHFMDVCRGLMARFPKKSIEYDALFFVVELCDVDGDAIYQRGC